MKIYNINSKKWYSIIFVFLAIISILFIYKKVNIPNYSKKTKNSIYLNNTIKRMPLMVITHRGKCFDEPENSIHAIEDSINCKVDYAEIDVQETKDGIVVLMHDKSLKRLTGLNKTVNQLNYSELEKLSINSNILKKYKVERIPTLEQAIKECNGKIKLIIEIKPYANTGDLTNKVVDIIGKNKFTNQCMVHSLSYNVLLRVKKLNPNITTGYILYKKPHNIPSIDVDFYSVEQSIVTENLVTQIHKSCKKIYVWTVDDKNNMKKIADLKVDGIITNKPEALKNMLMHFTNKILMN